MATPEDIVLERNVESLLIAAARRDNDQVSAGLGWHSKKSRKKRMRAIRRKLGKLKKSLVKGIKKAAPIALAAAATYYSGGNPQVGAAVLGLTSSLSGSAKTRKRYALAAGAVSIYGLASSAYQQSQVVDAATGKTTEILSREGFNMASPAAKEVVKMYLTEKQAKVDKQVVKAQEAEMRAQEAELAQLEAQAVAQQGRPVRPPAPTGFNIKTLLPVIIGAPLLFLALK